MYAEPAMHFWYERMPYLRSFASQHRVLHLGPGREDRLGVSIDIAAALRPSVVGDLARPPFPFRDSCFDAVYAFSVLEHLPGLLDAMAEIHRVLRPGGFVSILTPHFSNDASFIDPSHVLHLSARSFDYLIEGTELFDAYGFYSEARFRLRTRLLMLESPWCHVPFVQRTVNRYVAAYERHLCYVVRGRGLYFELEAVK
jgi:SAM-dependent methyltransferase